MRPMNNGENKNNRTMGYIIHPRKSFNQLHHSFIQECFASSLVAISPVVPSREEVKDVYRQMDRQTERWIDRQTDE